jgi:hypothetical protein
VLEGTADRHHWCWGKPKSFTCAPVRKSRSSVSSGFIRGGEEIVCSARLGSCPILLTRACSDDANVRKELHQLPLSALDICQKPPVVWISARAPRH